MKHYAIGRTEANNDIFVDHSTVSRQHAELVRATDGRLYLADKASKNGTYRRDGDAWAPVRGAFVTADDPIRIGDYETTAAALLAVAKPDLPPPAPAADSADSSDEVNTAPDPDRIDGPVERNDGGQIVPKGGDR